MINSIAGIYRVDTTKLDGNIVDIKNLKSLKLTLLKNGEYYFSPNIQILSGYEGTWDISNDSEYSNFIFECKNGKYETNRVLAISFEYKNKQYDLYFGK